MQGQNLAPTTEQNISGDSKNAFSEGTLTFPSFDFTNKLFLAVI